jgi:hypothetical protein
LSKVFSLSFAHILRIPYKCGAKLQQIFDMCKKNRNKVKNDNYELAKEVVPLNRKDNYEEEVHSKSLARLQGGRV